MVVVQYHLQQDGRYYSLAFVHRTRSEAKTDCRERSESAIVRTIELDQRHFGVYTATEVPRGTTADADMSEYSDDTMVVVETVLALFEVVDEDQSIQWYKSLEEDAIADAIERVQWKQSAVDVGGQLISLLILSHGLPNANHRTAIAFLDLYLNTIELLPETPQTNIGDDWAEWVNSFIRESKRLTTLRRKAGLFEYLSGRGATVVRRKNNVDISLAEYGIDSPDPWSYFETLHRDASIRFVGEYVERAGVPELRETQDDGKRVLASRL